MTKSCIFKNLNLRRKTVPFFAAIWWKIPQAHWPEVIVIWAPFERRKVEVHIFDRANILGFATWEFTTKED